jgi:hypothetical protein
LVHARVPRRIRAHSIFLRKSLSKVADDFDPYPTNLPYIEVPVAPVPRLGGKIVWSEVQYLCYIVKPYKIGSAVLNFYIGFF